MQLINLQNSVKIHHPNWKHFDYHCPECANRMSAEQLMVHFSECLKAALAKLPALPKLETLPMPAPEPERPEIHDEEQPREESIPDVFEETIPDDEEFFA